MWELWESLNSINLNGMWLAAAAFAFFGWKTVGKLSVLALVPIKRFGFGMLAASAMTIIGLGGIGVGVGDLATRSTPLRHVDSSGQDVNQEYVKFDGVFARLDKESKKVYPVSVESEEQRLKWNAMSDTERKLVWDMLRSEAPEESIATDIHTVGYEQEIDPFDSTLIKPISATSIDQPAMSLQATWGTIFTCAGLLLTGLVTGLRRVHGNKFDKPVNHYES